MTCSVAAVGDMLQTLPERCGLPASSVGLYARVVGQAQPLVAINAEQPQSCNERTKNFLNSSNLIFGL